MNAVYTPVSLFGVRGKGRYEEYLARIYGDNDEVDN